MRLSVWFLLLFWVSSIHSQVIFTVAEWNVENLFDCIHDEGKEDQLFLAGDGKYWSKGRLWKKETNLAKTIASMALNSFPDVVALIEVENHHVMDHLTRRSPLRKMGYHYVITESDDARGIDVALMYLPYSFQLLHHAEIIPRHADGTPIKTRNILHASGRLFTGDTLHLFVCHFSSKLRGKEAEQNRRDEALTLRHAIDSLLSLNQNKIIVTGDFNDQPSSPTYTSTLQSNVPNADITATKLYNLSATERHPARNPYGGTYKFDGKWEMIDHFLLSGALLLPSSSVRTSPDSFQVWAPDFLLEDDPDDLGLRPKRTYLGYQYHGGYSDHLPILTRFTITPKRK